MVSDVSSKTPAPTHLRSSCKAAAPHAQKNRDSRSGATTGRREKAAKHKAETVRVLGLICEAREEMEFSTNVLSAELENFWRSMHAVSCSRTKDGDDQVDALHCNMDRSGRDSKATPLPSSSPGASQGGKMRRSTVEVGTASWRLPPEGVGAILAELAKLRSDVEARTRAFQRRQAKLVQRVKAFKSHPVPGKKRLGKCGEENEEMHALEEEIETMRHGMIMSYTRFLGRLRELQALSGRECSAGMVKVTAACVSASTNCDGAANDRSAEGTRDATEAGSVTDLGEMDNAAGCVPPTTNKASGEPKPARNDGEKLDNGTPRPQSQAALGETAGTDFRSCAVASAAEVINRDALAATSGSTLTSYGFRGAGSTAETAMASEKGAEDVAVSEEPRLKSLRREAAELENRVLMAEKVMRNHEARAAAARTEVQREEARLARCRNGFAIQVKELQRGIERLESEALRWRKVLDEARFRLGVEEEEGRSAKAQFEADKKRLLEETRELEQEARAIDERVREMRRRCDKEGKELAREARKAAEELEILDSKVTETESVLLRRQAKLERLTMELQKRTNEVSIATERETSLQRQVAKAASRVAGVEAEGERAIAEEEAARWQHEAELASWNEAVGKRRAELEQVSGLLRSKTASLGDVENELEERLARLQEAKDEHEIAEARTQAALQAAREATSMAEQGKHKAKREEARAAAAAERVRETLQELYSQTKESDAQKACSAKVIKELKEAKQVSGDARAGAERAQKELVMFIERRKKAEDSMARASQRAAALGKQETAMRAAAVAAKREERESRDAVAAARNNLAELQDSVDRERRTLESIRDQNAVLDADVSRKKEEGRFASEAADKQQARLDDIKREVTLLRDERLGVEKTLWTLQAEFETLSVRRDDATRRNRRREREEGALVARRDALAEAVAREKNGLNQTKAAKEALEAEVAELDARAEALAAEANIAAHEASALREDASTAAGRADEARKSLAALERDKARALTDTEALRASKDALKTELTGLREELKILKRGKDDVGRGESDVQGLETVRRARSGVRCSADELPGTGVDRATSAAERVDFSCASEVGDLENTQTVAGTVSRERNVEVSHGGRDGAGAPRELVAIFAGYDGRLREQVQAALSSANRGAVTNVDPKFSSLTCSLEGSASAPLRKRTTYLTADPSWRPSPEYVPSSRRRSCYSLLGELGRRVGNI